MKIPGLGKVLKQRLFDYINENKSIFDIHTIQVEGIGDKRKNILSKIFVCNNLSKNDEVKQIKEHNISFNLPF